jgi:hypothetical protein
VQDFWGNNLEQTILETDYHEGLCCSTHNEDLPKLGQLADTAAMGQVPEAKSSDILEHSPDDEIEGEIVYLQSRLLNGVVSMKQRYVILKSCRRFDTQGCPEYFLRVGFCQ